MSRRGGTTATPACDDRAVECRPAGATAFLALRRRREGSRGEGAVEPRGVDGRGREVDVVSSDDGLVEASRAARDAWKNDASSTGLVRATLCGDHGSALGASAGSGRLIAS
ncbi:MAG: hypothetical protein R3A52_15950 [Polyangiales bacterium]